MSDVLNSCLRTRSSAFVKRLKHLIISLCMQRCATSRFLLFSSPRSTSEIFLRLRFFLSLPSALSSSGLLCPRPCGGIKRRCCLTSVCLSGTSGLSREQRPRKTKIGAEVAHVIRDSDTTFKVKGHQAALLTAVLARQAAAAVGVVTCWPWETAATLPSARRRPRG